MAWIIIARKHIFQVFTLLSLEINHHFFNNSGDNAKRNYDGSAKFISEPDTIYNTMENSLLRVASQEFSNLI